MHQQQQPLMSPQGYLHTKEQESFSQFTNQIKNQLKLQSEPNRFIGRFQIFETLGKGGQAWVKRAVDNKLKSTVAIKFLDKHKLSHNTKVIEQIKTEITALKKLSANNEKNKHIIKLLAYSFDGKYPMSNKSKRKFIDDQQKLYQKYQTTQYSPTISLQFKQPPETMDVIYMVLEYMAGGELFDLLYYKATLNEAISRIYFKQLVNGLEACHSSGIVHRDLKPQNLLLNSKFMLKISDFGLSKFVESIKHDKLYTSNVGTNGYQAPEILEGKEYTSACDIFSIGVVLFTLLAGYPPFEKATINDYWYKCILKAEYKEFWLRHKGCGIASTARDLITRMLRADIKKRISIKKIKAHKWFLNQNKNDKENENNNNIQNDEEYLYNYISKEFEQVEQLKLNDTDKDKILKYSEEYSPGVHRSNKSLSFNEDTLSNTFGSQYEEVATFLDRYTSSSLFQVYDYVRWLVENRLQGETRYDKPSNSLILSIAVQKKNNNLGTNDNKDFKKIPHYFAVVTIAVTVFKSFKRKDKNLIKFKNISDNDTVSWADAKNVMKNLIDSCAPVYKKDLKSSKLEDRSSSASSSNEVDDKTQE